VPVELPAGTFVTSVAAGHDFALAATSTGAVYAWGYGGDGELGNGSESDSDVPVEVELPSGEPVTEVAAGHDTGYALLSDGQVFAWGNGQNGQLGDNDDQTTDTPVNVQFDFDGTIVAIAAGAEHALALGGSGEVFAWGEGGDGQLGNGGDGENDAPQPVDLPAGVTATAIAAGHYFSLAVTSTGAVYSWGDGSDGQLGDGADDSSDTPVQVELPAGADVTAIAGGSGHALALTASGTVYAWGDGSDGQLGDDSTTSTDVPVAVKMPAGSPPATAVAAGDYFSLALLGAPVVSRVTPEAGPAPGGTPVTIFGLDFAAVRSVLFGGVPATSLHTVTGGEISAVAPAEVVGSVGVTVVTANGTAVAPSRTPFAYSPLEPVEAPLPAGAPSPASTTLAAISCTSATTCVAVGEVGALARAVMQSRPHAVPHPTAFGGLYGLIEVLAGGHWTPLLAPEPGDAGTKADDDQYATLDAVSCSSATRCTAVGSYEDDNGYDYGLVDTLSGGTWTAMAAPLPGNAGTDGDGYGDAFLNAVSCPSATSCAAVGSYEDNGDYMMALVDTLAGSAWSGGEAPLPAGAGGDGSDGYATLYAVSCPTAGTCAAGGRYEDTNGFAYGLLDTLSSGTWAPAEAPEPANAAADFAGEYAEIDAVDCPAAGRCTAVGQYEDTGNYQYGLLESLSGGTWSAIAAPQPANAGTEAEGDQGTILTAVSCGSVTRCVAAGSYSDASGNSDDLIESGSGTAWAPVEGPQPAGAAASGGGKAPIEKKSAIAKRAAIETPAAERKSSFRFGGLPLDCVSVTACTDVGSYGDAGQYGYGLVDTLATGHWGAAEAPEPAGAGSEGDGYENAYLQATSCVVAAVCYSVGSYTDSTGTEQGLIEEPAIAPLPSASAAPECLKVALSWTDPPTPGFAGVDITRSSVAPPTADTAADRVATAAASATSYTDGGLTPGDTYYYALFAKGAGGFVDTPVDVKVTESCPALPGYREEGGDGGVFAFHQTFRGSVPPPAPPGLGLHIRDATAMAVTGTGGYWVVESDGGVFSFGATDYGSLPGRGVHVDDIVGAASTPYGGGFWMVGADGTVYAFGDAPTLGSLSGLGTSRVVAIASADLGGYWIVTSTGNVVAFGDARYWGSCQDTGSACAGATDIVGIEPSGAGGYWLAGRDGGVFTFGDARFRGSCPAVGSSCDGVDDVVGIASPDRDGYWLAEADGRVIPFGDARYFGDEKGAALTLPIVGISF
jgi:hypothetical protein